MADAGGSHFKPLENQDLCKCHGRTDGKWFSLSIMSVDALLSSTMEGLFFVLIGKCQEQTDNTACGLKRMTHHNKHPKNPGQGSLAYHGLFEDDHNVFL